MLVCDRCMSNDVEVEKVSLLGLYVKTSPHAGYDYTVVNDLCAPCIKKLEKLIIEWIKELGN